MQFLYGNHVLKNGLGRITENTPAYTGVVVYSMSGEPRWLWAAWCWSERRGGEQHGPLHPTTALPVVPMQTCRWALV